MVVCTDIHDLFRSLIINNEKNYKPLIKITNLLKENIDNIQFQLDKKTLFRSSHAFKKTLKFLKK